MFFLCCSLFLAIVAQVKSISAPSGNHTAKRLDEKAHHSSDLQHPLFEYRQYRKDSAIRPAIFEPNMTLYFGYGSNLWQAQMAKRCQSSLYAGVARLERYRWIIYKEGYANIVETDNTTDVVYGLVYVMTPEDEASLDSYEGVLHNPPAYSKELLPVSYWPLESVHTPSTPPPSSDWVDVTNSTAATSKSVLCYINRNVTTTAPPKKEYITRMNEGIKDAEACGVPNDYIKRVIRAFIPDDRESSLTR